MVRQIAKKGTAVLIEKSREFNVQRANSTKLLVLCPLCTIVSNAWRRDPHPVGMLSIMDHRGVQMDTAYGVWMGHSVVLQVALGDIKVPLRGRLLKDGGETVRVRIGEGWDVDIYKAMILAVEEDAMALLPA
jgi:hypothetical protein